MRNAYLQAVQRIPRDGWILILASVSVGMGYFGFHAVAFNLYLLRMGYGPEFIGLLNGVAMAASALCAIPAGIAGRRWGLRRMMLLGFAIWTAMSFLLPLADLVPVEWRSTWLLAIFTITWMAAPLWMVNQPTYMVGITSPVERQHAFAISRASSRLGAMVGSLVAGLLIVFLADRLSLSTDSSAVYRYVLYIAPFLYLTMMVLLRTIRPVDAPKITRDQATTRRPIGLFLAMALFIILSGAAEAIGETYFNVYMDDALQVSPALIGSIIAAAHLISVPATLTAPVLVARWQSRGAIIVTGLGMVVGISVLALTAWWLGAASGYILLMAMASTLFPIRTVYHQEVTVPAWRSSMSGVVTLSMQLGRAAVVFVGGIMVARFGYSGMFMAAGLLTLAGILFFWSFLSAPRNTAMSSATEL